jgi:signal transduction histidine kinase
MLSTGWKKSANWRQFAWTQGAKIGNAIARPQPISPEYRQWRERLTRQRFWLAIGLAVTYLGIDGLAAFYELFINPEQVLRNLELVHLTHLLETVRRNFIVNKVVVIGAIGLLIGLWRSAWGRRHPAWMLVLMPWAITFMPEMFLGAYFGIPRYPSVIMFMAQAAILPIHWRLHLLAQVIPIAFYFVVYPLIGLATFGGRPIYSFSYTVQLVLVCVICEVGVYLYEQSKQAELAANRRLQLCIHAITHDLRTPVMGSLMLLESMQKSVPAHQVIPLAPAEMAHLIQGYDRLLALMNTLLDNQTLSQNELILNRQPTALSAIVTTILQDFHPALVKNKVQLNYYIPADLPAVNVDAQQIWRVLCNLIGNAINHNPPGIELTLDAVVISQSPEQSTRGAGRKLVPKLKVIVQDNGIGIAPAQQPAIFEPYTRTQASQYQPGLGLGLYICRQIVLAHNGEIGLESLASGTAFWFTLPLA